MWTASASLSGVFPLQTTYEAGFAGAPPQWHPPSDSLCLYCTSPPHPDERNAIDGVASSNWKNGYTIWTFHWRRCCSTENITITAFIRNTTAEGADRFQRNKTIPKIDSGLPMVMGRDVCPWCKCQSEKLRYPFPEGTGEFGLRSSGQRYLQYEQSWKRSVVSNRPQGWVVLKHKHYKGGPNIARRRALMTYFFSLDWWRLLSANVSTDCSATKILD